jgi:hypothetical protein
MRLRKNTPKITALTAWGAIQAARSFPVGCKAQQINKNNQENSS